MKHHKLFYGSSYDRGLQHLLELWPQVKEKFPDATLDIAYGWDIFDKVSFNNPERVKWKEMMLKLINQNGITDHGRIGKEELKKLRKSCGILAYPSHFTEIFCITAAECQADGLVPVTTDLAALKETVVGGITVSGEIHDDKTKKKWLEALFSIMSDSNKWEDLSNKGKEFARQFEWKKIANKWTNTFTKPSPSPLVTVFTPTIRKGWWNIMADNLSKQTYKNFEWIIVDDFPGERENLAIQYASKYKLNIKYLRGKKRNKQRTYKLINANNTALQESKGELLVFFQDFIIMPEDGIEQFVDIYNHNPDALICAVDRYVAPKINPIIDSEDWFNGSVDVIGEEIRVNVRVQNKPLRESTNPYDFEQNYGAIPVKIAKELGGWWEFLDEGIGYDNTDIAYRAIQKGYRLLVDELNIATCVDHWEALRGTRENVIGRARKLNDPRFLFIKEMIKNKKLDVVRHQEKDDSIELLYDIPDDIQDKDVVKWINTNGPMILKGWLDIYGK